LEFFRQRRSKPTAVNIANIKYENEMRMVINAIEEAAAKDRTSITSTFEQEVNIERFVQLLGMSQTSLKQWFKKTTGMSIGRYAAYRRAQYAMRAFRLPSGKNSCEVSQVVGVNEAPALYPILHRFGINKTTDLRYNIDDEVSSKVSGELKQLPNDQIILTKFYEGDYAATHTVEFENEYWGKIEAVINRYPDNLTIKGYVGIAIDNYIDDNEASGRFIAGVRCTQQCQNDIAEVRCGELGKILLPAKSLYKVYTWVGSYDDLIEFYHEVFIDIFRDERYQLNLALPLFEQYPNSPSDTPERELITEVWVPVNRG
jgi:AraC-like DNA-binding protein/DNA gyrase inhibitor GyrI